MAGVLRESSFHEEVCRKAASDPLLLATDLADYLVQKGVPFRKAHHVVGELVGLSESQNLTLTELTDEQVQATCPQIGSDWREVFLTSSGHSRKGKNRECPGLNKSRGESNTGGPSLTELSALPVSALAPFLFLCLWSFLSLEARVWTTTSGAKSDGELFEVVGDRIGLRIRGRDYHFSLSRFSPADQAYVKQWMRVPRCEACSGTLGTRTTKAGKASYHTACFRCMVCRKNFGPGNRFRKDGWGGMVHVEHFPQTGLCGTCSRIFPKRNALKEQFFADGRMTCGPCLKDGIFKLDLLKEVDDRVWKSLVQVGFAKPKGKIILELVDQKTLLREAAKINASGNLRSLTLTKYRIVKGGKNPGTTFDHRIYVLYGLPYVECISVLAHEHIHVWLNERFIDASLRDRGFLQLGFSDRLAKGKKQAFVYSSREHEQQHEPRVWRGLPKR